MDYQAIDIVESEKSIHADKGKRAISPPNKTFSKKPNKPHDNAIEVKPALKQSKDRSNKDWLSNDEDEYSDTVETPNHHQQQQEQARDEAHFRSEASLEYSFRSEGSLEYSLNLIERRLEERRQLEREEGTNSSSICIFRLPHGLIGTNKKAEEPEIVSIGPYHRGRDHLLKFEEHKWYFLDKILSRGKFLSNYLAVLWALEGQARACYSDVVLMSSHDFVEMMLLDACFIIGLLCHLGSNDKVDDDDPIFSRPWIIPFLIRDLLKLENQLPFFVLKSLFYHSWDPDEKNDLTLLALKVFDLTFPRPIEILLEFKKIKPLHLLDLFYQSLLPSKQAKEIKNLDNFRPSTQSIQCVTQLKPSRIRFKPRKANSFLDIKYQNRVLEIPTITVNDFTSTLLLNSVAWEQCQEKKWSYFTDYICFMNCLINQPKDVTFLCLDGIITRFSQDDMYVADLFNNLGKNVVFNSQNCYLSQQFKEVDEYFNGNWASMMRTYFNSPWAVISVFSAFFIIVLSLIQTIMSVLSYQANLDR